VTHVLARGRLHTKMRCSGKLVNYYDCVLRAEVLQEYAATQGTTHQHQTVPPVPKMGPHSMMHNPRNTSSVDNASSGDAAQYRD
jgi:hypothetical protein